MIASTKTLLRTAAGAAVLGTVVVPAFATPEFDISLKGQIYVEGTDYGSSADRQDTRTDIHFQRVRLAISGQLDETWGFKFQTCGNLGTSKQGSLGYILTSQDTDWNDRDVRVIDAYATGDFSEAFNIKVGLTKIPLTRANLDDCFAPLSLDRSMFVYSAYGSSPAKFSRDMGIVAWGDLAESRVKYFAGAMQGREGFTRTTHPFNGQVVTSSIEPKSSMEYIGRIHYAFLDPEYGSGYVGTYFGEQKILTVGIGAAFEPDAVYRNVAQNGAVTGDDTVDYSAFAADLFFEHPLGDGAVTVNAQYLKLDFDDAYLTNFNPGDRLANITGINGQKDGWYLKGAYLLPKVFGKEGRLQPYVSYEDWEFAHLLGINNQKITQTGLGLNYYVRGQNVRVTLEYLRTEFGTPTGLIGGRVNPTTFAPIDFYDEHQTVRLMFQIVL